MVSELDILPVTILERRKPGMASSETEAMFFWINVRTPRSQGFSKVCSERLAGVPVRGAVRERAGSCTLPPLFAETNSGQED